MLNYSLASLTQTNMKALVGAIHELPENVTENIHCICVSNTNVLQIVGAIINRPLQGVDEYCTFVFET